MTRGRDDRLLLTRRIVRVADTTTGYGSVPMDTKIARQLLERRMEDLRQVARATIEQGGLDRDLRTTAGDVAPTEAAELATETVERELDLSVREAAEASLHDVQRALQRLEKGTYGVCLACGRPIGDGRLEAKPEAEYCIEHQPR
jgi:RNA polymerase-binding protein DksA